MFLLMLWCVSGMSFLKEIQISFSSPFRRPLRLFLSASVCLGAPGWNHPQCHRACWELHRHHATAEEGGSDLRGFHDRQAGEVQLGWEHHFTGRVCGAEDHLPTPGQNTLLFLLPYTVLYKLLPAQLYLSSCNFITLYCIHLQDLKAITWNVSSKKLKISFQVSLTLTVGSYPLLYLKLLCLERFLMSHILMSWMLMTMIIDSISTV